MGEGVREVTQTAANLARPGITATEVLETDELRKALNRKWDGFRESLIARNQPMLKQTARLLEALLQKELGGDTYQYMVGAPTARDVPAWKLLGWEMLTVPILGRAWKPGSDVSFGVHQEADGQLMWGGTKQHYLMFIRKDVWQRRQAQQEAENEAQFNRHLPQGSIDTRSMRPGDEATSTTISQETARTVSRSSVGKRGPGRPRKG